MLGKLSATDLAMIARNSGGLEVDGTRYSATDLAMNARNLNDGATLKIHNSERFSATHLAMIARNGQGKVVFT